MTHRPDISEQRGPRRRCLRFRLRTLLILVAIVAIPLAWIGYERRQSELERQCVEKRLGVAFEQFEFGGPFDSWELRKFREPQGWWRELARQTLGERVLEVGGMKAELVDLAPLGELNSLQSLSLVYATLDESPVSGFEDVRFVRQNKLSDLSPLSKLKTLQELTVLNAQVNDLAPLAKLAQLQRLSIGGTPVSELAPLAGLKKLRYPYVSPSQVVDITPLAALTSLEELTLSRTNVSDIAPLTGLVNLRELLLDSTPTRDIAPLSGLSELQLLWLQQTQVTDVTPLAHLKQLNKLRLCSTSVRDISALAGASKLEFLDLHDVPAPRAQITALRKALPNCWIFDDPDP
jgi:hypothetical protein